MSGYTYSRLIAQDISLNMYILDSLVEPTQDYCAATKKRLKPVYMSRLVGCWICVKNVMEQASSTAMKPGVLGQHQV